MKSSVKVLLALALVLFCSLSHVSRVYAQDDMGDESETPVAITPVPTSPPIVSGDDTYEEESSDYNTDEEMDF